MNGGLAVSRALGDWHYKSYRLDADKMAVSSYPDVHVYEINQDTKFLIIACDGIWDCMTS